MVMVCQEFFPIGSYKFQKEAGFYMEIELKAQLDFLIKNIENDWAFTILITGRGEVRVGKSVLGMQIAFYWVTQVNKMYNKNYQLKVSDNYVFNGNELIKKGNKLGTQQPFTSIVYDEAGADIQGIKVMSAETKEVLDYLRECGQYNMLTILILPDYFSLPRGIALTYSTFLIDVNYYANDEGIFQRGFYDFYNRKNKKKLYLFGKKTMDYDSVQPNFRGHFSNAYTIDEKEYRQSKRDALKKREKPLSKKERLWIIQRNIIWCRLYEDKDFSYKDIAELYQGIDDIEINYDVIRMGISSAKEFLEKNKNFENSENRDLNRYSKTRNDNQGIMPYTQIEGAI